MELRHFASGPTFENDNMHNPVLEDELCVTPRSISRCVFSRRAPPQVLRRRPQIQSVRGKYLTLSRKFAMFRMLPVLGILTLTMHSDFARKLQKKNIGRGRGKFRRSVSSLNAYIWRSRRRTVVQNRFLGGHGRKTVVTSLFLLGFR